MGSAGFERKTPRVAPEQEFIIRNFDGVDFVSEFKPAFGVQPLGCSLEQGALVITHKLKLELRTDNPS